MNPINALLILILILIAIISGLLHYFLIDVLSICGGLTISSSFEEISYHIMFSQRRKAVSVSLFPDMSLHPLRSTAIDTLNCLCYGKVPSRCGSISCGGYHLGLGFLYHLVISRQNRQMVPDS